MYIEITLVFRAKSIFKIRKAKPKFSQRRNKSEISEISEISEMGETSETWRNLRNLAKPKWRNLRNFFDFFFFLLFWNSIFLLFFLYAELYIHNLICNYYIWYSLSLHTVNRPICLHKHSNL